MQAFQHLLHGIANTQGFAGSIGQRQGGRVQRRSIKMLRLQPRVQLGLIANQSLTEVSHRPGERHHGDTADQVVEDVEIDNQFGFLQRKLIHDVCQQMHKRQDNQATHQLKQQAAERHAARGGISAAVV